MEVRPSPKAPAPMHQDAEARARRYCLLEYGRAGEDR
jgi:hypothetical protein